jgi:hypothetical protein
MSAGGAGVKTMAASSASTGWLKETWIGSFA